MSCHKFEDYLNDRFDSITFEKHLKSCEECRIAFETDSRILKQSKNLNKNLEIPDLWPSIEENIQAKKPVILKFKRSTKLLLAAAASFLVIITIWIFSTYEKEPVAERILSQKTLQKVQLAEEKYLDAINDLEDLALHQLENTTEPLAQLYRNKLSLIDRQIENCKNALETNPANSHIRQYLMAALQDKQKTLEEILELRG
jgi:hypothetical protein